VPAAGEGTSITIYPGQVGGIPNPSPVGSVSWDKKERVYRVTGLPSGQYVITSQWIAGNVWAFGSKRITINGGNAGEVVLDTGAEDTLPVAVSYDPPDPRPPGYFQLISASGVPSMAQDIGGTQAFRQLKPGSYALIAVGNAYVKSAHQGGRDALRDGVLVPEEGSPEPLEVSIGNCSSSIETTADLGDTPGGGIITVAFLRQTPLGLHLERQTSIYPAKDPLKFIRMSGLRPTSGPPLGEYIVMAWTASGGLIQSFG
jgi:hypothetical protein